MTIRQDIAIFMKIKFGKMKKYILTLITISCISSLSAQINFSYQLNGLSAAFYITQSGNFYEGVRWVFGDGTEVWNNSDTIYHTYSYQGTYNVCVYGYPMPISPVDSLCKEIVVHVSGITEVGVNSIMVYDEANKQLYINLGEILEKPVSASAFIFNTRGRKLIEQAINKQNEIIDLRFLKSGMYIINLKYYQKEINKKIILI